MTTQMIPAGPSTAPVAAPTGRSRRTGATLTGVARLILTEMRLVLREPVVLTFVFAFPVITVLVLGGVFDPDDPAFEGIDPSQWFVAAYIGVLIAAVGLIMLPVHLAGYREKGVTRRFRVSGFPSWALPVAHFAIGMAMATIGAVALLVTAELAYGVPPMEDLGLTLVGTVLGAATFVSLGILVGTVVPTARSAQGIGMLVFFPSFLLGGGGPPPDAMGSTMRTIADWIPLTHVVRSIQEPWLDVGSPTVHLAILTGILVASTTAWLGLQRRT